MTEACEVGIQIPDLTGKSVATPINTRQQAGEYKIDYNASGLGAVEYFSANSVPEAITKLRNYWC